MFTGHSFYGAVRYVHKDESRAVILATEGVRSHDYRLMIQDFELQHGLRPTKKQACFHSILSFYPGENLGDKTMVELARKYLAGIGITNTQYAITKHTDKAHLHLHIIANMVDNNGNSIKDNWIGLRGKKVAQQLTQQYQLVPAIEKKLELTHLEALSQSEANKYKVYIAITDSLPQCRSMEELEAQLLKQGIETQYKYKSGTNEKQGVSFKIGQDCFKGSKVDRKFSLAGLERVLALQYKQMPEQQKQKPVLHPKYFNQNPPSPEVNPLHSSSDNRNDLFRGLQKAVETLIKPEEAHEHISNELSKEAKRKRRKKHSQHH